MEKPPTQKDKIRARLRDSVNPFLAVHEFNLPDVSENSLASRLPEMAIPGEVVSRFVKGKPYKEWALKSRAPAEPSK